MNNSLPFTKIRVYIIVLALLILSGGIGYRLGERQKLVPRNESPSSLVNETQPNDQTVDFSLFWDVWRRLQKSYVDKADLDPKNMVEGAIRGMVASLGDPYTAYLSTKENKEFHEDLSGAFEGIGAQLGLKDNRVMVVAPVKGAPAEKAGLLPGDWILEVNDEETLGWTVPQAVTKIRGPKGTTVKLEIMHENEQKTQIVSILRDTISIPSVIWWVKRPDEIQEITGLENYPNLAKKQGRIVYLELSRFGDTTNDDWEKAIADIQKTIRESGKVNGIVFDLRNNPGGYLDGAVFIAGEFLKSGTVVSQVNSDGSKLDYPVSRRGKLLDIPVVVLVNKGTASAAEIVAGALRDRKRAKVVGEVTYGKGSVQTPEELPGGASIHITTGKWLTPNGDSIHKKGITPDILVSLDSTEATKDSQLAKAIEMLLQ